MSAFRRALLRWIAQAPAHPRWRDPSTVGRQETYGAAILDTAEWLAANGFGDLGAGARQQYAAFLLEMRHRHELQGALR